MNKGLLRARWAALGAAVAVSLGGGAMWMVDAAPADAGVEFVAITPCRLLATRPSPYTVGVRSAPLGATEAWAASVWGTNGNCTIPTTATAVSLNVTILAGTRASNLTIYPADAGRPGTSNLNWRAGDGATPNAVTVGLSATGSIGIYNAAGTVQVIVDIVGYYTTESKPAQIVTVAKSGGDFTLVSTALASITDATAEKPYVIDVAPGVYTEPVGVDLKSHVDIRGAGRDATIVQCSCGGPDEQIARGASSPFAVFRSGGDLDKATISDMTITNTGSSTWADGVQVMQADPGVLTIRNVTVRATGATNVAGVHVGGGRVVLESITSDATSAGGANSTAAGLSLHNHGVATVRDSTLTAVGGTSRSAGLYVLNSTVTMHVTEARSSGANSYGIYATATALNFSLVESFTGEFAGLVAGGFASSGSSLNLVSGTVFPGVSGTGVIRCAAVANPVSYALLSAACA